LTGHGAASNGVEIKLQPRMAICGWSAPSLYCSLGKFSTLKILPQPNAPVPARPQVEGGRWPLERNVHGRFRSFARRLRM
jgi:hypothetical protein